QRRAAGGRRRHVPDRWARYDVLRLSACRAGRRPDRGAASLSGDPRSHHPPRFHADLSPERVGAGGASRAEGPQGPRHPQRTIPCGGLTMTDQTQARREEIARTPGRAAYERFVGRRADWTIIGAERRSEWEAIAKAAIDALPPERGEEV